jgi:uncharacterized membrane protein
MRGGAKLFGHPVHPMLIVFPLGLLATSVVFDLIYLWTDNRQWAGVSYWMIAAGVIGGVVAGIFGLIDYLAIPTATRAKAIGMWHGLGNVVVLLLFAGSWILRRYLPDAPGGTALLLSFLGVMLALVTGWLGGELVDRLGVGVDDGAHPNSPSSLSNRPATDHVSPPRAA